MNGKDFKAWASQIADEAEVQTCEGEYRKEWTALNPAKIQAVLKPKSSAALTNLETVNG